MKLIPNLGGFDTDVTNFYIGKIFEKLRRASQEDIIIPEHVPDTVDSFEDYNNDKNPYFFQKNKNRNFHEIQNTKQNENEDKNELKVDRYHNDHDNDINNDNDNNDNDSSDSDSDSDSSDDEKEGQIRPYLTKRLAFDQNFYNKKFEKPRTQKLSFFLPKSCFSELRKIGDESQHMMLELGR